jgi:hypothetical protein
MNTVTVGADYRPMNKLATTMRWRGKLVAVVGTDALLGMYSPAPGALGQLNIVWKWWPVAQLDPVD